MSNAEPGKLCVSIHDVAPATWPDCLRLWSALRAVADIPLTWLVVPRYHGNGEVPVWYVEVLENLLERGHELALHGYTHMDRSAPPRGLREKILRQVWTEREGEFAVLGSEQARRKLALGRDWFAQHGWPVHGFVAPAWLVGEGTWEALAGSQFAYTTTYTHFHCLRQRRALFAPTLMYATRNAAGRRLSRLAATAQTSLLARAPLLLRLSLHPRDAQYPELVRHMQRRVAALLEKRQPLTKAAYAAALQ